MEPEFMLLARRSDGSIGPADETDRLDKPCYDYKGLSRSRAFIERLVDSLQKAGFDVYQVDHEDANGQFEINFTYSDCLTTADRMVFFRMAAGEIGREMGLISSFMPKPLSDRTGSGMHMHLSLADAKNPNLFLDRSDGRKLGLSAAGYQFLGGLLAHAPALTALVAPTVNSYKRLVVGRSFSGATWAPCLHILWRQQSKLHGARTLWQIGVETDRFKRQSVPRHGRGHRGGTRWYAKEA
jgi:glutamine synthetase